LDLVVPDRRLHLPRTGGAGARLVLRADGEAATRGCPERGHGEQSSARLSACVQGGRG
jgi:hypothetical protein